MFDVMDGIRSILVACETIKPNGRVLVIADNEGKSMWLGNLVMNIADSMGASEVSMIILNPLEMWAQEPPEAVAAAMKCADSIVRVSDKASLVHTTARKEATAVGARYQPIENVPWEDIKMGVTVEDMQLVKNRTEALAKLLAEADNVKVTTPGGTDITVSLAGRGSLSIHPLSPVLGGLPYYAEAAAPPVEGTAEGTIVVDVAFIDWDFVLREPVRLTGLF